MAAAKRRAVVIVRAGEKSLHRGWLAGERNWDLIVSWYGTEPYQPVSDERVIIAKGWKWDILAAHFAHDPDLLARYDYFWLPDDDIECSARDINAIFEMMERYRLEVAQPALTLDSFHSFPFTLRCASFLLRYTSCVEVMVPGLSRAAIQRSLPYWPLSSSGFGLGEIWTRLEADNRWRSAVIDAVPVRHTRPVGVFLKVRMKEQGLDPYTEYALLRERFGLSLRRREFPCYAGISGEGHARGRFSTFAHMLGDYSRARKGIATSDFSDFIAAGFKYGLRGTRLDQLFDRQGQGRG